MVAQVIPVENFDLVIFGGTGDLSRRKILPALYCRRRAGQLPADARIIAAAHSDKDQDSFRDLVRTSLQTFLDESVKDDALVEAFLDQCIYVRLDALGDDGWSDLREQLREDAVRAFYFSVGPSLFGPLSERLVTHQISTADSRIVVEKPFGHDLESARALNNDLAQCFKESQIYRIDHYLGKETVQNLMALRFANVLFEPLWNSHYVDHVQITAAEEIGVEGRGAYYDQSGAMRDMVQNHLMQLLCLTAMEPPAGVAPDDIRNEKLKVINALTDVPTSDIVRGQYRSKGDKGSYLEDCGNPDSRTESFIALKTHVETWRWAGTPFYLRTGKRLRNRMSEIAVTFKEPPHNIFADRAPNLSGNTLVIRLQPDEGIKLHVLIKEPGPGGIRLTEVPLDMTFADLSNRSSIATPDAYERLLMDVIRGDQTLFMRGDEVEAAWSWADRMITQWEQSADRPRPYDSESSGPEDALMLMHRDNRRWREIEK
ncbi:glucose-6-phosphate dehydrogenase [Cohaesibacter gelatinilyticus]|uniref:Glucose-6-phosphate 1-dehydrogenase n=1 Tax=Cohaesibacter gelatinilyticus TaxID=372072 RepID=A0A285PJG0_9HYPH|nr:glucose-6-phosphate dehydrogenase [Cohaesibacter gelatinilyticus]SNZ21423.1 glucose-6-phosphate 1-dehydrogenase [Cohaesibacter gelatinilyticus]